MTASNLDEVRKAAADHLWHHDPSVVAMSQHILATIPANPTAPIDAEWLRECWGVEDTTKGNTTTCEEYPK